MMHRSSRRLGAVVLLASIVAALAMAASFVTGRTAFVSTHGVSMNPLYYQGDLVVVAKSDSYRVGETVAYRIPATHIVVLHRIIGGSASGFVMKGDNNQSIDPTKPAAGHIIGRAVLHIPRGGLWLDRLTSPLAIALFAFAMTAGGGTVIQTRRRRKRAAMSRHADHRPRATRSVFALPAHLRASAAAIAVIAALGIALSGLSWATPSTVLAHTATVAKQEMTFSYIATVAPTAAYDDTTVRSPDPIFRRLATAVQLHLAYQGSPGAIAVNAELSTPGGWHSTVPLAPSTRFTTNAYDTTVRLDLKAIDARAQAAAAATGLPAGPVSISVAPGVRTAGQPDFTPTLNLTLTPLALSLVDAARSLTLQNSRTMTHVTRAPHNLGLLGHHLAVSQGRIVSAIVLLLALLATAVLALIARYTAPAGEAAAIRRRYAPLLAAVHPITTPSHLPLIEVAKFTTLAKLAERCGLLVLHWSRSNVDTFVVLDEGTTYRYRTGNDTESPAPPTSAETDLSGHPEFARLGRIDDGADQRGAGDDVGRRGE